MRKLTAKNLSTFEERNRKRVGHCDDEAFLRANEKSRCKLLTCNGFSVLAERTGLEPATPGVTGRYSNQLNYRSW